ncbi:hypothetical protein [Hymenobacter koreensis]|uniref:Uncharacterized protein n=1 Tax=Hymenobacter koreensis TaxID=1084523 RepID=A0ABP8JJM4_9BACT
MRLYTYLVVHRQYRDDNTLEVLTLNGICWSPTAELVQERAELYAAKKFPGTEHFDTSVCQQDLKSHFRDLLRGLWIQYRPRFK